MSQTKELHRCGLGEGEKFVQTLMISFMVWSRKDPNALTFSASTGVKNITLILKFSFLKFQKVLESWRL